ncbi:MAG: hypothetical protein CW338_05240, partial [Clostridiales bacterium]|nr:hypothetical protein [Clostridiales bacterium]
MVSKLFRSALMVQIVAGIVGVIGMVVDGAVTGRCLGTEAMAAYGLVTPVATIFVACAGVCELGASILIGRLVGARKMEEASSALTTCLLFALILSLLMSTAVFCFAGQIARLLGADGVIADMGANYLRGYALCAPALLLLMVLMPVMQVNGKRQVVLAAVVTMTAVNITGDLFVGFVFKGGLFGMAFATTVSYFAALVLMLPYLFRKDNALRITVKGIAPGYAGQMLSGGLPNALQQVCKSVLIIILNSRLLRIADSGAVAAFTAIMSAANLCMALGSGIGSAVSMLTGVFAGDRDDVAIRQLVRTAVSKAVLYDAVLCALLLAGAGLIMPVFTSDAELLSLAVPGFRLYCLSMIGYAVNVTLRLYYQAMERKTLSYIYVVANSLVFTALGALVLGSLMGVSGIWLSFLFGETMSLLLLAVYVLLTTGKNIPLAERFMLIPADLTQDVLDRFDGSDCTAEGIVNVSEDVCSFCLKNSADDKTAFILSLAVEEFGEYILKENQASSKAPLV